jgi:formylglycine-generating enzyme
MHIRLLVGAFLFAMGSAAAASPEIDMVMVKGGCYQMGDVLGEGMAHEKPAHRACLDDFSMGKYVVTQAQWMAVMGSNPSKFKECGGNCPVEQVSWEDTQGFIAKLNQVTTKHYRLPTEAEWEYAARSGGKRENWAGTSEQAELTTYAWFRDNSEMKTHPVGQLKPNGLGLYDMSGNVWEWCSDWFDSTYYQNSPEKNPRGPSGSYSYRVLRGGSFLIRADNVRVAMRNGGLPVNRGGTSGDGGSFGFRLVLPAVQ